MRGEDVNSGDGVRVIAGSPPHARGRRDPCTRRRPHARITPACAGKTTVARVQFNVGKDHPRMRGEDLSCWVSCWWRRGSPPHARGRRYIPCRGVQSRRITPACAGKTESATEANIAAADHPRMRGEDSLALMRLPRSRGSPPHARGRLNEPPDRVPHARITPACAGKTRRSSR